MIDWIKSLFSNFVPESMLDGIVAFTVVFALFIISMLLGWLINKILYSLISKAFRKTKNKFDDIFIESGVLKRGLIFVPFAFFYFGTDVILSDFGPSAEIIKRIIMSVLIAIILYFLDSMLEAIGKIVKKIPALKKIPIKGYLQLLKIFIVIIGIIFIVSTLIGKSPWGILSGIGAMTAILLLVFRDTILGFVASIQISSNDMVNIGDWIAFPKYGADGDVIDITLNTIKVQNWDKTISTIPTYALISESFKNWKGMSLSGGRRIKRRIHIDMNSIKFCDKSMLEEFKKMDLLSDYMEKKLMDIKESNEENVINKSVELNGRCLTNIGTFRAYINAYLLHYKEINNDMTLIVRHLQPGELGLPIEIYAFSKNKNWVGYEGIQADLFDHIIAAVPFFQLKVFQNPSGGDIEKIADGFKK